MYNLEDRKMKEINYRIITLGLLSVLFFMPIHAQNCQPSGTYTDASGEKNTIAAGDTYAASAPLSVSFTANSVAGINPNTRYEWHFFAQDNPRNDLLVRYEENTDYTFTKAGTTLVYLYEILDGDTTRYDAINISISESSLQMPNAFTPNGDGINDVYRAKPGYKSIVEFRAIIFNRWGQKLYEWTDPAGGWDGKYKGKDVAQGTYFVNVTAKGADGKVFNIKRDVNLLRGYSQTTPNN